MIIPIIAHRGLVMKKSIVVLLLSLIVLSSTLIAAERNIDPSQGLILANDHVRFEFEPTGMGLSAMIDKKTGYNHIKTVEGKHLLWEVAFGKGRQIERITNNYKPCNYARIENLPNGSQRAVMEWNELRWWLEDSVVTVQVTVELPKDCGIAKWRIFVENLSDYWGLWEANYPRINGFPASGEYDAAIPTCASGGHLIKNWDRRLKMRSPSGFFPMQFMALTKGTNSVYFASMDGESRAKDFFVNTETEELAMIRYPENMGVAGSDFPDNYPAELGVYQGDWVGAAHKYRSWALKQIWTQNGTISQRADFPEIAANVGLWLRGFWKWEINLDEDKRRETPSDWEADVQDPHEMNKPFFNVMERLPNIPLALHWYRWHHVTFDNQYPHYLPALPGFGERVGELTETGSVIMPYINGLSADSKIADWYKFDPHAIKDEAGGLRQKFYWDGAGRLLPMCPNQVFWHDEITTLVDSIIGDYGVNGIYIDEVSCNSHELCFNKDHGHPLGGGRYWADGWRKFYRKIQNVAQRKGRKVVVTSEAANEIFFDQVTANLFWAQPTDWEIPMMEVVYAGYSLFFGSPCDYKRSNRFFNFAQGQAFIDGRQNGWMDFGLFAPQHSEKVDYFKQCGEYRVAALKFLTYGRLWGPVRPANSIPTFKDDGFGWRTKHVGTVPCAEGRLWQSEDGHLGVVMANYVNEELPFAYSIDPADYGLKAGSYRLREITPDGTIPIESVSGTIERTENLGPRKIKVIEIVPVNQ